MEAALQHHGIPNMHWGEKNGPPYPLTREQHNAVVRGGDIKTLRENITEFEDWEIEKTLKRFNYNQTIDKLKNSSKVNKGKEKFESFMTKVSNTERLLKTSASAAENGVRLYNVVANVLNTFGGKNMKTIPTHSKDKDGGGDKKKDDNGDNKKDSNKTSVTDTLQKMHDKHEEHKKKKYDSLPEWKKQGFSSKENYEHKQAAIESWKHYEKEITIPKNIRHIRK